ncbi:HTH domain-containing protein [Flavobacterium sp.]|uniref:HTH domain-containing protein n=1 Tax=Flavobacterium sp. TaxID=239 RepID=UPI0024876836|nr:HTH domain-containing protein [Flavobacterium sp.]MDI1315786.1 HTH domain-containing protein [Flavobacterium sp.]
MHELIKDNRAGNSEELSMRLGISVRSVYNYITYMKSELNAPITYDSQNKIYCYERECELNFGG